MNSTPVAKETRPCWFVGAMYEGRDDQTSRFVDEGIWENGYQDKFLDEVKSIQVGDRIAIKAAYVRKKKLPFDNRGQPVSTMAIKAIGIVTHNEADGRNLKVRWTRFDKPREWYFYTFRATVWKVIPGEWTTDALIAFAFDGQPQDISLFRNAPYWSDRFGDELLAVPNDELDRSVDDESDATPASGDSLKSIDANGPPVKPCSINDIIADGCFINRSKLDGILARLRTKKNLILQGPPGTGKSWLAKRLGFALMGEQDPKRLRAVQFHPNLSYEDFVRGHRPVSNGKLELVDGPFLEMIAAAESMREKAHVVVIEEINRGNPAQIFGEMLTLLEGDKRKTDEALELCYRRHAGERIHIPDNLFVIGTMNIADRSIAPLDMALRRRFAFIDLEPTFGTRWSEWVRDKSNVSTEILADIENRLMVLNADIAKDKKLGPQFRIGHSFVTPHHTERHQLLERGRVACRFEELTVDTPRNRFVRAALEEIANVVKRATLAHECRTLASTLRRMSVTGQTARRDVSSVDRFGRHDIDDQRMVTAAQLAFDLALPTEESGLKNLPVPDREITWVRKLYEKAVDEFYKVILRGSKWRVRAQKSVEWPIEAKTSGIDRILPGMRTDVEIDDIVSCQRIVIDTKFTSIVTRGWYRDEAIRSGYLYQMYAYLRSQEGNGDSFSDNASGLLLHPAIGDKVDESVVIQGHEIRFATVDLTASAKEIRQQLLRLVARDPRNHMADDECST